MDDSTIKIVQISDIHLFGDSDKELLGVNTALSFMSVLENLNKAKHQPDVLILTGDLSQDGSKASYVSIANACKTFPFPIYYLPGNHDKVRTLARVYPRENICNDKQIICKPWQMILLNSQKNSAVEGELGREQLDFLEECLQKNPDEWAMVFLHHPPLPVGSAWLDKLGLTNSKTFWSLLANYPQVKSVVFGHVHQEYENKTNGINCYGAPSTCVQFKPNHDRFELDNIPQGYRWLELYPDGSIKTQIVRLNQYVGKFESKAKGY